MPLSIGVNLRVTGHCNQGRRKYMEDMFSVAYQQTSDDKDLEYAFFGIFDGHGGGEAATFAKEHLMDIIVKQKNFWSDKDEDVLRAIRDGYVNTHYAMWRELDKWPRTASGLPSTAGTTASIAFIRKGKIYIGHVGDSGIVLGYQEDDDPHWKAKALTKDHKPESGPEMTRIQESGGKVVSKSGVPRVVWNRPRIGHKGPVRRSTHIDEIPFLAVARSLGDLWSYNSELDTFVVSPEPDVKVVAVDVKSHRCLIFGTDGLWNVLTPKAAVSIVQAAERHNEKHLIASQQTGHRQADVQMWINPSKSLVDQALERWFLFGSRADNTSVVTLMLDPPGPSRSEVLLSQKKEHVPASKGTARPAVFVSTETAEKPSTACAGTPFLSKPRPLISPKVNGEPKQPDSSNGTDDGTTSNITKVLNSMHHRDKGSSISVDDQQRESSGSIEGELLGGGIQVAEISSSDTCVHEVTGPREETESDKKTVEIVDGSTSANDSKQQIRESGTSLQILVQQVVVSKSFSVGKKDSEESTTVLANVVRQNAFSGTCEELKKSTVNLGNKLRRDGTSAAVVKATDGGTLSRNGGMATKGTRRSHHGSLTQTENSFDVDACAEARSRGTKRRHSSSYTVQQHWTSSDVAVVADSRLRVADSALEKCPSGSEANDPTGAARRQSFVSQPSKETLTTTVESCTTRRTRSDDRRQGPIDENDPANQEPPHSRLRWPGSESSSSSSSPSPSPSSSSSLSRAGTTSSSSTTVAGQERHSSSSPNSFQRRSLEKKATPVKTIRRRPSINGSNRIQLRGSFGLRDWEQQARANRTVCVSPTDSPPQRWLRSDTIAATPIKTLRSRNVDITGHTVSAQLANRYGTIKQNRLSLPAPKSKQSAALAAKVKSSSLSTGKLKQTNGSGTGVAVANPPGNGSGGMAKRAKSPYNPSARSLSTRSRIKRLGK